MSAVGERSRIGAPSQVSRLQTRQRDGLLPAVTALVVTACLPLTRVYIGTGWLRPVLAAALLAVGVAWACRRVGFGPPGAFAASVVGWFGLVGIAFLGDTLIGGVVPTPRTVGAAARLWGVGVELVRIRPVPASAEPGLLLLTMTGVWAVAYTVEGMVFRLAAPVQAIIMALVLWVTPLVIAPSGDYAWELAAAFLAAAAWLLLAFSDADRFRWGAWADPARLRGGIGADMGPRLPSRALRGAGWTVATAAIAAGVLLGGLLPGAHDPPLFRLQGFSGTTLVSNPIVGIKARLVAADTGPVLRVQSPRPVYLRVTALDVYDGQREEWTSAGIRGTRVSGRLPGEEEVAPAEEVPVTVTVEGLEPGAVLVPALYRPVSVSGPASRAFQYDPRVATFTLDRGVTLQPGDQYGVVGAIPAPRHDVLNTVKMPRYGPDTELPKGIPPQVGQLARDIVDRAGATTPFEQALAIQDELRTWTYSLNPAPGHGSTAMLEFLETREGYCEQFAGTTAVMLRILGIPARVAVGYTPGTLNTAGEYVITNANAHAWVEVRFGDIGWIAFEPTPRADGNLLVPSATNLAPHLMRAQEPGFGTPTDVLQPGQERPSQPGPGNVPGSGAEPDTQLQTPGEARRSRMAPMLLLVVATLAVGLMAGGVRSLHGREDGPATRVLRARAHLERLGRGLGVHPVTTETDREHLERLAGRHPAGERLAAATSAACYAPAVTEADAEAAEQAMADLRDHLLGALPIHRRVTARCRGLVATALRPPLERISVALGSTRGHGDWRGDQQRNAVQWLNGLRRPHS